MVGFIQVEKSDLSWFTCYYSFSTVTVRESLTDCQNYWFRAVTTLLSRASVDKFEFQMQVTLVHELNICIHVILCTCSRDNNGAFHTAQFEIKLCPSIPACKSLKTTFKNCCESFK